MNDQGANGAVNITIEALQVIVNDAFKEWDDGPENSIQFSYGGLTSNGGPGDPEDPGHGLPPSPALDGDNVIVFGDLPSGALAITCIFTLSDEFTFDDSDENPDNNTDFGGTDANPDIVAGTYAAGAILDADIIVSKDSTYWSTTAERKKYDLQASLTHEIGHFIGLSHSCIRECLSSRSVLFPFALLNPMGLEMRDLSQDDRAALLTYYPEAKTKTAYGSISGHIDINGAAWHGAHIWAVKSDDRSTVAGAYSDASGDFTVNGLPPGQYILRAEPLCVDENRINEIIAAQLSTVANFQAGIYGADGQESNATLIEVSAGETAAGHAFSLSGWPFSDPFEPDNTATEARWIGKDHRELHQMTPDNDQDWYRFSALGGNTYRIETLNVVLEQMVGSSNNNTDTLITLYEADGTTILRRNNDVSAANTLLESAILFTAPETEDYLIKVTTATEEQGRNYDILLSEVAVNHRYVSDGTGADPSVYSGNPQPFTFTEPMTLIIAVDGNAPQEITLAPDADTAAEVAAAIMDATEGVDASDFLMNGLHYVRLISKRSGLSASPAACIQVIGGSANGILAFPTTLQIAGNGTAGAPWASIQYAMDSVCGSMNAPEIIHVAAGTYYENITCDPFESLVGGYDSASWQFDPENFPTVLDGRDLGTVITAADMTEIRSLTIQNGSATYGGGINCTTGESPHIEGNIIQDCRANRGGGIALSKFADVTVLRNHFLRNVATGWPEDGGALAAVNTSASVVGNIFIENTAGWEGGAITGYSAYVLPRSLIAKNQFIRNAVAGSVPAGGAVMSVFWYFAAMDNLFLENSANGTGRGGALAADRGANIISGNIFAGNSSDHEGGACRFFSNGPIIDRNIFVGNVAPRGGAVKFSSYSPEFRSNLFVGNTSAQGAAISCESPYYLNDKHSNNTICFNDGHGFVTEGNGSSDSDVRWYNNIIAYNSGIGFYESVESCRPGLLNNNFAGNLQGNYFDYDTQATYILAADINALVNNGQSPVDDNVDWDPGFLPAPAGDADSIEYFTESFQSVLTDNDAMFEPGTMEGLTINPDTTQWRQFYIISNTETSLTVWGDMTAVASAPCHYQVFDYHLMETSQNIDAGFDVSSFSSLDIDGDSRLMGLNCDIGADETDISSEGSEEGQAEGEGISEGESEGFSEGEGVSEGEGGAEGVSEGASEGEGGAEGVSEGILEGEAEGQVEGMTEGMPPEGSPEEGYAEGVSEGILEGETEGQEEGGGEGEGTLEGEEDPLLIVQQPRGASLYTGMSWVASILVDGGTGTIVYDWKKDGISLGWPSAMVHVVNPLVEEDAGVYHCTVSDGVTTLESEEVSLLVYPVPPSGQHVVDQNGDWVIGLSELLRVIQFFNSGAFHCQAGSEDGYAPGAGDQTCTAYGADYNPQDWRITLTEVLRIIQFFNSACYHVEAGSEDGYAPGAG
ncbi:MAG TPA: matrixin family metalloprotease [Candidatus Hydrogenedentes bacterium]|nr:matrixin family metalloprotease [Candidatus Hydrogenedentota bacterium]